MAHNSTPPKQWTSKPPILYLVLRLQELQAKAQKAAVEQQLEHAKRLLEHEIKKLKK